MRHGESDKIMSCGHSPQTPGAEEHSKAQGVTQQAHRQDDGHTIEVDVASQIKGGISFTVSCKVDVLATTVDESILIHVVLTKKHWCTFVQLSLVFKSQCELFLHEYLPAVLKKLSYKGEKKLQHNTSLSFHSCPFVLNFAHMMIVSTANPWSSLPPGAVLSILPVVNLV